MSFFGESHRAFWFPELSSHATDMDMDLGLPVSKLDRIMSESALQGGCDISTVYFGAVGVRVDVGVEAMVEFQPVEVACA